MILQRHVLKYERLLKNTRRPDVLVKEIKVLTVALRMVLYKSDNYNYYNYYILREFMKKMNENLHLYNTK